MKVKKIFTGSGVHDGAINETQTRYFFSLSLSGENEIRSYFWVRDASPPTQTNDKRQ